MLVATIMSSFLSWFCLIPMFSSLKTELKPSLTSDHCLWKHILPFPNPIYFFSLLSVSPKGLCLLLLSPKPQLWILSFNYIFSTLSSTDFSICLFFQGPSSFLSFLKIHLYWQSGQILCIPLTGSQMESFSRLVFHYLHHHLKTLTQLST